MQRAGEVQSISHLLRNHQGLPIVYRLKLRRPAFKIPLSLALSHFFPREIPFLQLWQSLNVLGHSHLCAFIPIPSFLCYVLHSLFLIPRELSSLLMACISTTVDSCLSMVRILPDF